MPEPHQELRTKLEKRANDCRIAGAVFYDLPDLAQTALYGIAAELDEAVGLIEQLEAVTRERDERLAVNVGLLAENTELKRKIANHPLTEAVRQELGEDSIPAGEPK